MTRTRCSPYSFCPDPAGESIPTNGAVLRPDEVGWPVVDGVEEVDPDDEAVASEDLEEGSGAVSEDLEERSGAVSEDLEEGSGPDVSPVGSA